MCIIFRSFPLLLAIALTVHLPLAAAKSGNEISEAYSLSQNQNSVANNLPFERGMRSATGIALNDGARSALQTAAVAAQSSPVPITLRAAIDASQTVNLIFTNVALLDARKPTLGYQAVGVVEGAAGSSVIWVDRAGVVSAIIQWQDRQLQNRQIQIRPMPVAGVALASGKKTSIAAKFEAAPAVASDQYLLVDIDQQQFRDHPDVAMAPEAAVAVAADKQGYSANTTVAATKVSKGATPSQSLAEDIGSTIDVLIVYTAAAVRAIGGAAAMDSHISLAIAQTNQAYALSGVRQQLRLVHIAPVDYAETGDLNLDLGALRTNGDGTLDDVHLLRDAYGADIVSLWVEDGGNSCGQSVVMSTVGAYYARSAFNVVARSCAVGNYSFAHELGHNMGLRHDAFVDPEATPYAYAHGYVDVANKFRTIMAYDDACVAAKTSCTRIGQFSSASATYGQFATGNIALANAAAALNATRTTAAAFKTGINLSAAGSIQFYPQNYSVIEGKTVALKVSRLGGSGGIASVRYLTSQQTATPNIDFRSTSGILIWRDGEDGEKIILIDTLPDSVNEGTEKFKVELFDFVGATPLANSINGGSTAIVEIFDSAVDTFPLACVLPTQGWSTPITASTGWGVGRDASTEGGCSLKSNPMLSVGNSTRAQLQFEGEFTAGIISFDRRVFSEQSFDCFRFRVDGIAVQLGGTCDDAGGVGVSGNMEWSRIEVPITAGRHTLLWSYEKDGNTSVGGDAAWIDRLSMPLPTQLARLEVRRLNSIGGTGGGIGSAPNSGAGNVIAQTVGINCGTICSADMLSGSVVTLTAIPDVQSILVGWTINGVVMCPVEPNSAAAFNGSQCAITIANATQAVINFAQRPARAGAVIQIAANAPSSKMAAAIMLQISVIANNPTGAVEVRRVNTANAAIEVTCANLALTDGQALCTVPANAQALGLNLYQVTYLGDAANAGAQETMRYFVADDTTSAAVSLTLTIEPATPILGQAVKVTALVMATITPADNIAPQGLVRFLDAAGNVICVAPPLLPLSSISSGGNTSSNTSIWAATSCSFVATAAAVSPQIIAARYAPSTMSIDVASASLSYMVGTGLAPDYTDMWWAGESQNGWGMSITQHGNTQFNVLYVYNAAGKPIWVVMPGGSWNTSFTEYSGAVYEPTSAPYYVAAVIPFTVGKPVGNVVLTFTSMQTAVLRYNINGVNGSKNIQRQSFGSARPDEASTTRLPVGDLWWGGIAENGWGINIAQQGTTLFGVWYTYDNLGNTTWMVLPGGTWQNNIYSGSLYTTTASAWLGNGYNANALRVSAAGSLRIEFFDTSTALMHVEIPAQNFKQSKVILRQQF